MNINDIKNYLNNRPFTPTLPTDEELTKYMNFAILIVQTFYGIEAEFLNDNNAITVIGEEVAYLLDNNPTEDVYKMYNYLKKFTVAGAISGEVFEKTIGFLAPFVKNLMNALGIDLIQTDTGKSYYNYNIF